LPAVLRLPRQLYWPWPVETIFLVKKNSLTGELMLLLKYICTNVCTRIKICCISNLKILNLYTPAPCPGRKRLISAYSELVLPSATMPPLQRQIRLAGSLLFLTDSKPLQPNWNAVEQAQTDSWDD
jgi:hypothetical protein